MHEHEDAELQRRLDDLAPFLQGLGEQAREVYAREGIMAALPDDAMFPVADALFKRKDDGVTYHPRGALYFSITRQGELVLAGQKDGAALTEALLPYVQLGRLQDVQGTKVEEAPTEWFPPPRLLLDPETSELYIASVGRGTGSGARRIFVPLQQYIQERARLFVEAFNDPH